MKYPIGTRFKALKPFSHQGHSESGQWGDAPECPAGETCRIINSKPNGPAGWGELYEIQADSVWVICWVGLARLEKEFELITGETP